MNSDNELILRAAQILMKRNEYKGSPDQFHSRPSSNQFHSRAPFNKFHFRTRGGSRPPRVHFPFLNNQNRSHVDQRDKMGHHLVKNYICLQDFFISEIKRRLGERKRVAFNKRLREITSNQGSINLRSLIYWIDVHHISPDMKCNDIFYCRNTDKYKYDQTGGVPAKSEWLQIINQIMDETGDHLQSLSFRWNQRNDSWTLKAKLYGKLTPTQQLEIKMATF